MLIETVKRWSIIALMIIVALMALVIMAMHVNTQAVQAKSDALALQNQTLITVANDNAKQIRKLITDNKANDELIEQRQQGKATAREQTRSNVYVVHQSLSAESCSTVALPVGAISMLKRASDNTQRGTLSDTSKSTDP